MKIGLFGFLFDDIKKDVRYYCNNAYMKQEAWH